MVVIVNDHTHKTFIHNQCIDSKNYIENDSC